MAEKGRPARPGWVADKAVRYLWRPRHGREGEPRRLDWLALAPALVIILAICGATYAVLRHSGDGRSSADVAPPVRSGTPGTYPSLAPSPILSTTAAPTSSPHASKRPPATPSRTPAPAWGELVIASTSVLTTGQSWSTNRLRLTVTAGGNLVLQDQGRTVWQTGTTTGVKLVMQNDGHLVLYDAHNGTAWSSGTAGNPGAVLILRADGHMVISLGGRILFRTGT